MCKFFINFSKFLKSLLWVHIIDLISHLTLRKIGLTRIKTLSPPMNGFESAIKWAQCTNKYIARHTISVPAWNWQAGRAPDLRKTIPSSSPDRRHFYSSNYFRNQFLLIRYCITILDSVCLIHFIKIKFKNYFYKLFNYF